MRNVRETIKVGRIVWHDLLTPDVALANRFYSDVFGWEYHVEHATEFAWGDGEADYPLIVAGGEAQGGIIESYANRWLAYVACDDVDVLTDRAKALGATVDREAFDVPGVGRSAVLRDVTGAVICPFVVGHNFPAPTGTFLPDVLIAPEPDPAREFYEGLFGWTAGDLDPAGGSLMYDSSGAHVASIIVRDGTIPLPGTGGIWAPCMRVRDLETALASAGSLGGEVLMRSTNAQPGTLVADPMGAVFSLR